MPVPATAASSVHPVSVARACPAVSVSQETRLSLPSRCSTITIKESGINQLLFLATNAAHSTAKKVPAMLEHAHFVAQLFYQLLRHFSWWTIQKFRVLGF